MTLPAQCLVSLGQHGASPGAILSLLLTGINPETGSSNENVRFIDDRQKINRNLSSVILV
jgi:hypothetical protein